MVWQRLSVLGRSKRLLVSTMYLVLNRASGYKLR
ncbi:Uncharacterised protein [Vibrio cholerae]|nr:Uncharacterised protein [Vibrio cholerae]